MCRTPISPTASSSLSKGRDHLSIYLPLWFIWLCVCYRETECTIVSLVRCVTECHEKYAHNVCVHALYEIFLTFLSSFDCSPPSVVFASQFFMCVFECVCACVCNEMGQRPQPCHCQRCICHLKQTLQIWITHPLQ